MSTKAEQTADAEERPKVLPGKPLTPEQTYRQEALLEAGKENVNAGTACGSACGHCGGCS